MGRPGDRGRQIPHAVAGHVAKTEIAGNGAAGRGDRARAALLVAENEAPDGCSADRRHGDRPLAEMRKKKFPDHPATLSAGVLRQAPDVAHVGVEAHQLLSDDGAAIRILPRHAVGLEYLQKVAQRRLQFMARPTDRIGAGARRQVLREKAHDGALPDRFQVVPFLCQPMAEVRYAAHIDSPGARRISPTLQVLPVLRNVGPKNAGLRPKAGRWLNDNLSSHADLLPTDWAWKETTIMLTAELQG